MWQKKRMVKVRTAKAKGSSHEYDCQESLQAICPDIYRTSERGFQLQYDLCSDEKRAVFECKRLAGISWNQAKKYLDKLHDVAPKTYKKYLLFRSNRQPCLVMSKSPLGVYVVWEFEQFFGVPFVKHKSTRSK